MKEIQLLHEADITPTQARIDIVSIIKKAKKPIDSASIVEQMQKKSPETNRATVFRTINMLTAKGILRKCEFEEGKSRYELSSLPHHHHIVCTNCGALQDIEGCGIAEVEERLAKQFNFKINSHRLEFFGLCKKCQKILV